MISFFVPGTPKAQPRARGRAVQMRGRLRPTVMMYDPGDAKDWKAAIAMVARKHVPKTPILGPVELSLTFYMPRPKNHFRTNGQLKDWAPTYHISKPDRDNLEKAVMDALTQLQVWKDDGQVCKGPLEKLYANPGTFAGVAVAGVAVQIAELPERGQSISQTAEQQGELLNG